MNERNFVFLFFFCIVGNNIEIVVFLVKGRAKKVIESDLFLTNKTTLEKMNM